MYRIHVMEIHKAFGKQIWTEAYDTLENAKERQTELNEQENIFVSDSITECKGDLVEQVQIQLQNMPSGNWLTMRQVPNNPWMITKALEQLKDRYPKQTCRAMYNGSLLQML